MLLATMRSSSAWKPPLRDGTVPELLDGIRQPERVQDPRPQRFARDDLLEPRLRVEVLCGPRAVAPVDALDGLRRGEPLVERQAASGRRRFDGGESQRDEEHGGQRHEVAWDPLREWRSRDLRDAAQGGTPQPLGKL